MTLFSYRSLAFAWTGLAGAAAVSAGGLQASYVPPPAAPPPAAVAAAPVTPALAAIPSPIPALAPVPFENRSLLAMLPPPAVRPHPTAERLPLPPVPPMRMARAEPRRAASMRVMAAEPAYAPPADPGWNWGRRLPYPGQYAMGRPAYYGPGPGFYGWQPQY